MLRLWTQFFLHTVQRTLFVVEAMLKSDIPDILSYLDLVLEELNGLTQSTNSSVKAKAKKVSVCVCLHLCSEFFLL